MRMADRLTHLDRRWIFLVMGLGVLVASLASPPLRVAETRPTRGFIHSIEVLPAGAIVLLACDYDPAALPELGPMTRTAFRHLLSRGSRVVVTEMWSGAPGAVDSVLTRVASEMPGKRYGTDWVDLGFVSGGEAAMALMGHGVAGAFPRDAAGRPIATLPLMRSVRDYSSLALIVSLSAGSPGTREWVEQVQARYHVPMVAGVTASLAPDCTPYLDSGQLSGLLAGMAGAAEYETARHEDGTARRGMGAQSVGHLVVALCIALGLMAGTRRRDPS